MLGHAHAGEHLARVDSGEPALVVLAQLVHSLVGLDDCCIQRGHISFSAGRHARLGEVSLEAATRSLHLG